VKERVVDANVLLRFLVGDVPEQMEKSIRLIRRIEERKETVFLPLINAYEVVFTLARFYKIPRSEIAEKLSAILSLRCLRMLRKRAFLEALNIYRDTKVSFGDAYAAAQMRAMSCTEIYSFDKDFDRLDGITRIEP
jgi:predicted nucleic acid-binding protein